MFVDFDGIREERLEHFKGGEGAFVAKMYVDETVRIIKGYLEPGASIGMHTHVGNTETIFITSGEGKMICDGKEESMTPGSCTHCHEGLAHSLINTGSENLCFCAVVPQVK